jgi:hypothetical protein
MRQLVSFRRTSPIPGSTDLGAHASTSELQKDFSQVRFQGVQIQVRMRQLMSFRRTSPTPGSTDSGAHASTYELQKDFSHSRKYRARCIKL